jgi:hypothetical protein
MEELRIHHLALPRVLYACVQTTDSVTTDGTGIDTFAIPYYRLRLYRL